MHRRTALTAGVSLLTIAAGCTSDGDTQSSDPDGTDDGEPESESGDEQELTLETFEYPESVDQDGFRRNLASVHEDRLAAAGSFQVVKTFERSETFTTEEEITITGDGDDLLLETGDEHLTTTAWTDSANDGTDVLVRNSNGVDERYLIGNRSQMAEDVDGSDTLGALIDAAMFKASELVERDGTSVVVFEAVDVIDVTALEGARSNSHMARYDELEASIVVSEAGVVGYRYELEGEGFDGPAVVTESATFDDVGETTLDEPDWVDEAEERALELSIEPAADGESFTVTVDQGEPIPAGA
ncbi:DUF7537 family lipoprotein [Natronococcus wangiae]|uniref:DUF7537 family lipoprotein n=1 Tax=Natronococcus wangiae TaxID=3068275 RepID=UPI00273E5A5F|nr:hypothetical protein [Natronococcus sp. AD5]